MGRRKHTPEQIINKLREAEVAIAEGSTVAEASRRIGVTQQTFYRWRTEYGGLRIDQGQAPEASGVREQPPEESGCRLDAGQPDKILSPNPPKDTEGRREDSGRGVRELQGRWPGLHWGRWEVGGRSSVAAQGPYGRLRELRCAGWREDTQQGTLADRGGASLRGRWVSCRLAVRSGVEWLAVGPGRD